MPNKRTPINITDGLVRRFWLNVEDGEPDECWPWKGATRSGYGAIKHEFKTVACHRLAYSIEYGVPDDSLIVGHKCDNTICCNPNHLELITVGQNNRDARERLPFSELRGEEKPNSVLTEPLVREIVHLRTTLGLGCRRIGKRIGVGHETVQGVIGGKNWTHITGGPVKAKAPSVTP